MIDEEIKNNNSLEVDIEQATPMFKQFLEIKRKYQGVVLLYRMGDLTGIPAIGTFPKAPPSL